jgi:hypothetical protein
VTYLDDLNIDASRIQHNCCRLLLNRLCQFARLTKKDMVSIIIFMCLLVIVEYALIFLGKVGILFLKNYFFFSISIGKDAHRQTLWA